MWLVFPLSERCSQLGVVTIQQAPTFSLKVHILLINQWDIEVIKHISLYNVREEILAIVNLRSDIVLQKKKIPG